MPAYLADHLRAHREAVAGAVLLNVVCGRLTEWTAPGLLLIGDAAHPMSPVGGQGVNIALRDALVAANHLVPVLTTSGDPAAIDAAARRVRDERWPEIVAVQQMQQNQARTLNQPDRWSSRAGRETPSAGPRRASARVRPARPPAAPEAAVGQAPVHRLCAGPTLLRLSLQGRRGKAPEPHRKNFCINPPGSGR